MKYGASPGDAEPTAAFLACNMIKFTIFSRLNVHQGEGGPPGRRAGGPLPLSKAAYVPHRLRLKSNTILANDGLRSWRSWRAICLGLAPRRSCGTPRLGPREPHQSGVRRPVALAPSRDDFSSRP